MRQWHATLMDITAGRGRDVRVSRRLGAGHGRSGAGWSCARRKGNTTPPSCDSRKRSSLSSGRRGASSHGVPGRPSQAGGSAVFRSPYPAYPGLDAHAASLSAPSPVRPRPPGHPAAGQCARPRRTVARDGRSDVGGLAGQWHGARAVVRGVSVGVRHGQAATPSAGCPHPWIP